MFEDFRGIIAQSPALVPVSPLPFYVSPLLKLAKILKSFGRITQPNQLLVDGINSDPEEVRIYQDDPLIYDRASFRLIRDASVILLTSRRLKLPSKFSIRLNSLDIVSSSLKGQKID